MSDLDPTLFSDRGTLRRVLLERYLLGELSDAERAAVDRALATSEATRAELEALRRDAAAFAGERPYAAFRIEHERRKEAAAEVPWRWPTGRTAAWLSAVAFAAAAVWVLAVPLPRVEDDSTRSKGAATSLSFVAVPPDGEAVEGVPGMRVVPGTRVQLSYDPGPHDHLAILGIDGRGAVTVHYPESGSALAPLPPGPPGSLPFALELDATPGTEWFIAVFAHGERALAPVIEAARIVAPGPPRPLPLGSGLAQSMVWMRKD